MDGSVEIDVETVGNADMNTEELRELMKRRAQLRANNGWTQVSAVSRGGTVYVTYERRPLKHTPTGLYQP